MAYTRKPAERWRGRRYVHFHPSLASAAALREHQTLGPRSARDHAVAKEEPNQCEISKDGDLPGKKARECMHRGGGGRRFTRQHSHKIKISRLNQEFLLLFDTWVHGKVQKEWPSLFYEQPKCMTVGLTTIKGFFINDEVQKLLFCNAKQLNKTL